MDTSPKPQAFAGLLLATLFLLPSTGASAPCPPGGISPGWNIFETDETITHFDPDGAAGPLPDMNFRGVPLGSHGFAGVGTFSTGVGDTVVRHLGGGPGVPIPTTVERLQFQSVQHPDIFVTLSSDRGRHPTDPPSSTPSTGTVTITGPNTFVSALDVYFDIRIGSVNGPIIPQQALALAGVPHYKEFHSPTTDFNRHGKESGSFAEVDDYGDASHAVIGPTVLITDVNTLLNGVDQNCDFHPGFL